MIYRLREPIGELREAAERVDLPVTVALRIATKGNHRLPAQADELSVELLGRWDVAVMVDDWKVPAEAAAFHHGVMPDLETEIRELLRPYEPFHGLRLWIKRDEAGQIDIDGEEIG